MEMRIASRIFLPCYNDAMDTEAAAALKRAILLGFLVMLLLLAAVVVASRAISITVPEWRNAPAGSALDVITDEPAHPPWNW
jgi:hypothetical protein